MMKLKHRAPRKQKENGWKMLASAMCMQIVAIKFSDKTDLSFAMLNCFD